MLRSCGQFFAKRPDFRKIPCKFPVSREFRPETGSQPTGSSASESGLWGVIFPVGENRRHSRRLGWGAPVSGPQFLAFRLLRGGFLAPVSGGDFPISVSGVQRPVVPIKIIRREMMGVTARFSNGPGYFQIGGSPFWAALSMRWRSSLRGPSIARLPLSDGSSHLSM